MTLIEDDSSFGDLLKALRQRARLTQHQLAQALGVHRITLVRWEQGDYLPESKTLVLDLARLLKLKEQEARQLLEASLTALAPHWSVPIPRNPYFTGREEILEALHRQLGAEQAVALTPSSALYGLGGVGKTQIALEYVYRHALEYSAVFWMGAETEAQIISSFLRVASVLQVPERAHQDQQQVVAAVQHWLGTHDRWLVIWDNVEELDVLRRFWPLTYSGAMLLTTRCQILGTLAQGLALVPMEQEEGLLFLLRRAKVLPLAAPGGEQVHQVAARLPAESAAAAELVAVLGGLPLALDQAGAYVEETHCSLQAYLDLFLTRRATLLTLRGAGAGDHPASVSTTLRLSITAAAERHPAVQELLYVCVFLQPDAIPEDLFRLGAEHLGGALAAACRDPLEWDRVVGVACSYSLLSRQTEQRTLSLHRLVQAVVLESMTPPEREQWNRCALRALDAATPEVLRQAEQATCNWCERLLPHLLQGLQQADTVGDARTLASLAYKTALYLHQYTGRYREVQALYQRALHLREQLLGPDHPQVADVLLGLATFFWQTGRYREAQALYQRALHLREQALGPDHPQVADILHGLATLFWSQGNAQAEALFQRALSILERELGETHPRMTPTLNNVAVLFMDQKRYAEAEALFQRALRIGEQTLGPDHPEVALPLTNLAEIYGIQGRYAEAEALFQRALTIWEQALGPEHPMLCDVLRGLANLCREQEHYSQAEALYQRALANWEQALSPEHPQGASVLHELAACYRLQHRDAEAERLYRRALSLREQHLGPDHPETAQTLYDLAVLQQQQGRLSEALSLAERALHIRVQALGTDHPTTIATRTLAVQVVQEQVERAGKLPAEQEREARAGASTQAGQEDQELRALQRGGAVLSCAGDPLHAFLDMCCELHPRAWCRSSDLWQAYERWAARQQERFPLSRRAFSAQVQASGFRADRTSAARIWRGITLVKPEP